MMEVEFVTGTIIVHEALWLGSFLNHFVFVKPNNKIITNYCDSITTLTYIKDPKYHEKSKNIRFKYNLIWDAIEENEVHLAYIPMGQMVLYHLFKLIPPSLFERH